MGSNGRQLQELTEVPEILGRDLATEGVWFGKVSMDKSAVGDATSRSIRHDMAEAYLGSIVLWRWE